MSHSSANTHPRNLSPCFSLSFPSLFPFFSLILSQLYRCLMLSPCCRERTEHLSSSGGWWWWWGVASPMLCSAAEHSLLWAGRTPVDWGSNLGPRPGSRLPQLPSLHHQIWATSMWASSRQLFFFFFFFFRVLVWSFVFSRGGGVGGGGGGGGERGGGQARQQAAFFFFFFFFFLVSNLLFVLASVLSMSREGCWGGNRGVKHAGIRDTSRASVA